MCFKHIRNEFIVTISNFSQWKQQNKTDITIQSIYLDGWSQHWSIAFHLFCAWKWCLIKQLLERSEFYKQQLYAVLKSRMHCCCSDNTVKVSWFSLNKLVFKYFLFQLNEYYCNVAIWIILVFRFICSTVHIASHL